MEMGDGWLLGFSCMFSLPFLVLQGSFFQCTMQSWTTWCRPDGFCAHAVTSQCGSKARCCPASEYSVSVFMICCSPAMSRFSDFFWDQMECWKILRAKQLQPKFKGAWSKFAFDTGSDPTWRGTALGWSFWQRQAVQLLATNGWFAPDRCFGIFSGLFDSQASRPIPGGLCFCRAPWMRFWCFEHLWSGIEESAPTKGNY